MNNIIDVIKSRKSVRTFDVSPLAEKDIIAIKNFLDDKQGPFGGLVRFALFDFSETDKSSLKSLGTYGIIRNAPLFIGAVVKPAPFIFEDLGYVFEECIIRLTAAGFGTCWMGGTFTRASFAAQAGIKDDEILGAISPVGRAHQKRSFMEIALRTIAGSRNRKEWPELFFNYDALIDAQTSLTPENAGIFSIPLECVRIAPSASNKQPWRIMKSNDAIHFFLKRTSGYAKIFKQIDLQSMDMGIALYHFEVAAKECGISGTWQRIAPACREESWEYITSFIKNT